MIRLSLFLCAGIFVMLMVLGEDRGQRRKGLMVADTSPQSISPIVETVVTGAGAEPLNLPAQPVMRVAASTDPIAEAVAAEVATKVSAPAAPAIEPVIEPAAAPSIEPAVELAAVAAGSTDGKLRWIGANSVNVREGPSTDFPVLGKLTRGEAVLVVLEDGGTEGWSRVRIEGDGIEGFVATRFLTEAQP